MPVAALRCRLVKFYSCGQCVYGTYSSFVLRWPTSVDTRSVRTQYRAHRNAISDDGHQPAEEGERNDDDINRHIALSAEVAFAA